MDHNNDYENATDYQLALSDFLTALYRFKEEARKVHPDLECDKFTLTIPEFGERINVSIETVSDIPEISS